ncbi:MAG TPA: tetratricopeptide repeat protein [Spirochaetota bacterium]|nr:tetratricopeptide repeat protein [Spirochaetota bacterium]HPJ33233.1 tetratricopeptide repeat protein [Spirochaetota bacterium]
MHRFYKTTALILLIVLNAPAARPGLYARNSEDITGNGSYPKYRIYPQDDILFCTGDDIAGRENNKAAVLMQEGKWDEAASILEKAIIHAPLFFPFRYNLGICLLYLNRLDLSLMHFTKAIHLVPGYYRTYLQVGYIYNRWGKESEALRYFRKALKLNPRELNTYILMGDIHFDRKQLSTARKYYEAALSLNHTFPNGLLGLAKIHFINEEYVKAIVLIKSVDTKEDYDKALHYYYAESSYKTGDYKTAAVQYEKLLQYKNDRFFLINSALLIKHKLELSRRFAER